MQSLEIDARRCKPHQAERPETVHAEGRSNDQEELRLGKIRNGSSFGSGRSRSSKGASRKSREVKRTQVLETDEETGATLWNRKAERRR